MGATRALRKLWPQLRVVCWAKAPPAIPVNSGTRGLPETEKRTLFFPQIGRNGVRLLDQ
jgi:hypothetical protein